MSDQPETAAGQRLAAELGVPYRIDLIVEAERQARAAAVAPLARRVHELEAFIEAIGHAEWCASVLDDDPGPCDCGYASLEIGSAPSPVREPDDRPNPWVDPRDYALSAPSPVREPEVLDVERLAEAVWRANAAALADTPAWREHIRHNAEAIAAEYARLTPERPADEVDG